MAKKIEPLYVKMRLHDNCDDFARLKYKIQEDAAVLI